MKNKGKNKLYIVYKFLQKYSKNLKLIFYTSLIPPSLFWLLETTP